MQSILLVEDNEDDAILTHWALQRSGIQNPLEVVSTGTEAKTFLDEEALPCLVLLDMNLTDMLGIEVLRYIRTHTRDGVQSIPVFILSGLTNDRETIARDVATDQANAFLSKAVAGKPFDIAALLEAAEKHHVGLERTANA